MIRHNKNRNKFTKGKGPWTLIVSFKCKSKSEAFSIESKLKAMKNPAKAIQYLKNLAQSIPTS
jgi:predicted GIY-YIG superfamily endonuclease